MDVSPNTVSAIAIEAWVMARSAALLASGQVPSRDAAVERALAEVRQRYPDLGGAVRRLNPGNVFG